MTVREAIIKLIDLPQDAKLMAPDMGAGGSVEVEDFKLVVVGCQEPPQWVDCILEDKVE